MREDDGRWTMDDGIAMALGYGKRRMYDLGVMGFSFFG
jgi:hypothetical protein